MQDIPKTSSVKILGSSAERVRVGYVGSRGRDGCLSLFYLFGYDEWSEASLLETSPVTTIGLW